MNDFRKKVLIFAPANSIHTLKWTLPFKTDFRIKVLTFDSSLDENINYEDIEIIKIPRLTNTKLDYILMFNFVKKFLIKENPDIVHAHYASSYGVIIANVNHRSKKILSIWGSDIMQSRKNFLHRLLINYSVKKYDFINTCSLELKLEIEKIGVLPEKILSLQYGIDFNLFDSLKNYSKDPYEVRVLSSRLWKPLYNIAEIIDGFLIAQKKYNNLKLILCGGGDSDYADKIYNKSINQQCIEIRGKVRHEDLISELWMSDIFISVPCSDGMSLSVMEALYCETFPILSNIKTNEMYCNYGNGLIIERVTSENISKAIIAFIEKKVSHNKAIGKEYIRAIGNYDENIKTLARLYS